MTPSPTQRAEQIVDDYNMTCHRKGSYPICCKELTEHIADALAQVERATWEAAMKLTDGIKEPQTKRANTWSIRVFWLAEEFRRRATQERP